MYYKELKEVFNVLGALATKQGCLDAFMSWLLVNSQNGYKLAPISVIQECILDVNLVLSAEAIVVLQKYNVPIVAAPASVEEL